MLCHTSTSAYTRQQKQNHGSFKLIINSYFRLESDLCETQRPCVKFNAIGIDCGPTKRDKRSKIDTTHDRQETMTVISNFVELHVRISEDDLLIARARVQCCRSWQISCSSLSKNIDVFEWPDGTHRWRPIFAIFHSLNFTTLLRPTAASPFGWHRMHAIHHQLAHKFIDAIVFNGFILRFCCPCPRRLPYVGWLPANTIGTFRIRV